MQSPPPSPGAIARLRNIKGFMFDMDGTLILGDRRNNAMHPLPGAIGFLEHLNERGIPWVVLTNGTIRSARDYTPVLRGAGLPLGDQTMMTPSSVAADYFVSRGYHRVMVLGGPGVSESLRDAGLEILSSREPPAKPVDAVYIGWYREFGFTDLEIAFHAVRDGAALYSASDAPFFATAQGLAIGTSCAIGAALQALTSVQATILGKPSTHALQAVAGKLGLAPHEVAVVGDDPDIEVTMALAGGALAVYVHSGTGGPEAFATRPPEAQPHISVPTIAELAALLW